MLQETDIQMRTPLLQSEETYCHPVPNAPPHQEEGGGYFTQTIGEAIFHPANVRKGSEDDDIARYVNQATIGCGPVKCCLSSICCATGFGGCYLWGKTVLIEQGQYGFTLDNGRYGLLVPGRYLLASPFNQHACTRSAGDERIEVGPISIIRVPEGSLGFAYNDGIPEILLPGRHIRNSAVFKFNRWEDANAEKIVFGPIKIFTVRSGSVRVCYHGGRVIIYPEGRYFANSATFNVAGVITTQQQNVRFEKHPVLLDGGISMLVEGLLTYQVQDVEKLIKCLGETDLLRAIMDISKAELSRVFAGIHLEQIANACQSEPGDGKEQSVLGSQRSSEGETRNQICLDVIRHITPITAAWGVKIINFQLESTKIADHKYAMEYEEASLAMAKAKANRRAVEAENDIKLQKARAEASAVRIEAEGRKDALLIEARGAAEARVMEAKSRDDAAKLMQDPFAKQFALAGQQVEFAKGLKAESLTVLADSAIGVPLVNQFKSKKV